MYGEADDKFKCLNTISMLTHEYKEILLFIVYNTPFLCLLC